MISGGRMFAAIKARLSLAISLALRKRSGMIGPGLSGKLKPASRSTVFTKVAFAFNRARNDLLSPNTTSASNAAFANGNGNGVLPTKAGLDTSLALNFLEQRIAPP